MLKSMIHRVLQFGLSAVPCLLVGAASVAWLPISAPAQCTPVWSKAPTLAARGNHSMAFDTDRSRVVMFGGDPDGEQLLGDTWEWDGTRWSAHALSPAPSPVGRAGAAMTYDPVRHRTVLFGGASGGEQGFDNLYNDTWEWDGSQWTQMSNSGPAPRAYSVAAFDPGRGRVVITGGFDGVSGFGDTWEWTGTAWGLVAVSGLPARGAHGMAYDAAHSRMVVFGGFSGSVALSDTWQMAAGGSTWTQVTTPVSPPARVILGLTYDTGRSRVVLFGGVDDVNGDAGVEFGDTWELNGASWLQVSTFGPEPRAGVQLVYDAPNSRAVLFGGNTHQANFADTWTWDGVAWTLRDQVLAPQRDVNIGMAYDEARAVSVLFGGSGAMGVPVGETWTWNGATWSEHDVPGPSPRVGPAVAYDAARGRTVLCGGYGPNGDPVPQDTWEWDGSAWTRVATTGLPAVQSSPAMAYDAARERTVLLGNSGDTMLWNGVQWTFATSAGPIPRTGAAMAYDAARGRIVLFGGNDSFHFGTLLGDTWEWNGSSWNLRSTTGPMPREHHAMVYDAARGRVVLIGGSNGTGEFDEMWEWSGSTWTPIAASGPGARFGSGASYDRSRNRIVLFGGAAHFNGNPFYSTMSDTWEFGLPTPSIAQHPSPQSIVDGSTLLLSVDATGGTVSYRWRKDTVPLNNGTSAGGGVIAGATGSTLTVTPAHAADAGNYDCVVTNACGSSTSIVALVTVTCPADFNGDGFLDFFDYNDFVTAFETGGGLEADFNGDGFVDFFDYADFVAAFEIGC